MNYLLIAIFVLLAWSIFQGYKKGFMKTVFALVSWILVLVVCNVATPMVTEFLMEETEIAASVASALEEKINEMIANSGMLEMEENVPEELQAALLGEDGNLEEILNSGGEIVVNSTSIVYTILTIISLILVIVVTRIILLVVDLVLGLASKLPIIGPVDKLLGIVCGGAKGLLLCWFALAIVSMMIASGNIELASYIETSQLLTWLQDNNFILKILAVK